MKKRFSFSSKPHRPSQFVVTIEPRRVSISWAHSPISSWQVSFWSLLLPTSLATYHSNTGSNWEDWPHKAHVHYVHGLYISCAYSFSNHSFEFQIHYILDNVSPTTNDKLQITSFGFISSYLGDSVFHVFFYLQIQHTPSSKWSTAWS
jgi:hypothetical protein